MQLRMGESISAQGKRKGKILAAPYELVSVLRPRTDCRIILSDEIVK
jgi:hypothetical protein